MATIKVTVYRKSSEGLLVPFDMVSTNSLRGIASAEKAGTVIKAYARNGKDIFYEVCEDGDIHRIQIPKDCWINGSIKTHDYKEKEVPNPESDNQIPDEILEVVRTIFKGMQVEVRGSIRMKIQCTSIGLDFDLELKDYEGSLKF